MPTQPRTRRLLSRLLTAVIGWLLLAPLAPAKHDGGGGGDFCAPPVLVVVVPYAAGGTIDSAARVLADALKAQTGKTLVVDNKPGAGGLLGTQHTMQQPGNGCTLLVAPRSMLALNAALGLKGAAEALQDLVPVAPLAELPFLLLTRADARWRDIAQLRQAAAGARLEFGSVGQGSFSHFAGALLDQSLGRRLSHIPYKGSGPLLQGLLAGEVALGWVDLRSAMPHISSGKLQALAVTGTTPLASLPGVPTTRQAGLDLGDVGDGLVVYVRRGGVDSHLAQLAGVLQQALRDPLAAGGLNKLGLQTAAPENQAAFAARLGADNTRWAAQARALGFKAE